MTTYGLGRNPYQDPRSLQYLVRNDPHAVSASQAPRSYTWGLPINQMLNQHQTPRCVGYSAAHEVGARPRTYPISSSTGDQLYASAQAIDRAEGRVWDEGASILAGLKALQQHGYLKTYRWATSAREFAVGVSRIGPGLLGVDWTRRMFEPDDDGYIWPEGPAEGGHAVLARGYKYSPDPATARFLIQNSWGVNWGGSSRTKLPPGCAWITEEALQSLLDRPYADAAIPVLR